jgi:hypothetical protein
MSSSLSRALRRTSKTVVGSCLGNHKAPRHRQLEDFPNTRNDDLFRRRQSELFENRCGHKCVNLFDRLGISIIGSFWINIGIIAFRLQIIAAAGRVRIINDTNRIHEDGRTHGYMQESVTARFSPFLNRQKILPVPELWLHT